MSQITHLAAVFDCRTIIVGYYYNWGEPERAPHRQVERSQSIYIIIIIIIIIITVPSRKSAHGRCILHWAQTGRWADIRVTTAAF